MPTSPRIPLLAVGLAGILLLGACGASAPELPPDAGDAGTIDSSSPPEDEQPTTLDIASLDACAVLPREDAESLIGLGLPGELSAATSDVSSCTRTADPNGRVGQVEIYVGPGALKQLEIDRDVLGHEFTQPSGIGDEAWLQDYMIFARTGETWASIRLVSLDDPAGFAQPLQDAMSAALDRLE